MFDTLVNQVVCGDCLTLMRPMPGESVDMVLTSPPYDNLRTYKGFTFDFEGIVRELYRVIKPGGVVVWVVGDATKDGSETGTSFEQALFFKKTGFRLHDTMIYHKTNYVPLTHRRYEQAFEYMFVFSKSAPKTFNPVRIPSKGIVGGSKYYEADGSVRTHHTGASGSPDKLAHNIFSYSIGNERNGHPAVFPQALADDQISSWSNPGDVILDPFFGSGTTGAACQKLGRNFIGIEVSPEYCDIARLRLSLDK